MLDSADFSTFEATDKTKYENDMTTERDLINQLAYREKKGRTEGKAEGIEIGETRGVEKNKLATAKKMLEMDFTLEVIAQVTELPMETIKGLK